MQVQPVYLTAEGVESLRRELEYLITVKRPALAERLRKAIQQGDLWENADYTTAKEEQGWLEGRIQQIEAMLRRAVIIENTSTGRIGLGSRVTVVEEGGDTTEEVFYIVGPAEADPTSGKVSNESPLGRALLGHQSGESVTVETPEGKVVFKVVAVQ